MSIQVVVGLKGKRKKVSQGWFDLSDGRLPPIYRRAFTYIEERSSASLQHLGARRSEWSEHVR